MNVEHNKQPAGSLKISQEVLATIANFASEELDGVVSLANTYTPIKYGANIPEVAETLQKTVKDAVQNMTGITISKVNVHVAGIVFPQTAPAVVPSGAEQ